MRIGDSFGCNILTDKDALLCDYLISECDKCSIAYHGSDEVLIPRWVEVESIDFAYDCANIRFNGKNFGTQVVVSFPSDGKFSYKFSRGSALISVSTNDGKSFEVLFEGNFDDGIEGRIEKLYNR